MLTLHGPAGPRRGKALGDLGLISDGAVLVKDGRIEQAGPARRVENLAAARGAREISATGRVVMPGFVDSHTHAIYPPRGERGAEPEGAARLWAESSARFLATRARRSLDAMLRHGSTTVEIKTGAGVEEGSMVKALRVIGLLRGAPIDLVPTHLFRASEDATDAELAATIATVTRRLLRRRSAAFADLWWNGASPRRDAYTRFLDEAAVAGLGVKVHAAGPSCAEAIAFAVGHRAFSVDHLEYLTPDLAPLLAGARTVATLMPAGSLDPWAPFAPARALIDSGAAVALASNFNPHDSPILSMQAVVAMACLHFEMSPAEAIAAATINGAHALGRGAMVGSLEPGKAADLLLLDADDYRELGRSLGVNLVHLVLKDGALVYRAGAVLQNAS